MEKEIWKDIKGYEGLYQVSNLGRVKSLPKYNKKKESIMCYTIRSGYKTLILRKNNTRKSKQIHRLVAEAFIPNEKNKPIVNHKDYNRQNNKVENLEWCTQKENVQWSICNMKGKTRVSNGKNNYGIFKRNNNRYEVTIKQKYIGTAKTKKEALLIRDKALKEIGIIL